MAAVLVASQWWYSKMSPPTPDGSTPDTTKVVAPDTAFGGDSLAAGPDSAAPRADPAANALLAGRATPGPVEVRTPYYRMTIDPRGGLLREAELLRYDSYQREGPVHLVPPGGALLERRAEVGERRIAIDSLTFLPSEETISLAAGDSARTLTLAFESASGRIVQMYRFDSEGYVVDY